jgi:hypothetical protein
VDDLLVLGLSSTLAEGALLSSGSLAEATERWLAERDPPRGIGSGERRADLPLRGSADFEDAVCCCMAGDARHAI